MERALFLTQRITAMILAPFVLVHLGLIAMVGAGELTAADILARTQGSPGWTWFYGLFVVAAAIHAPIGIRNILHEWTPVRGIVADGFALALAFALLATGARAVIGVS